MTEPVTFLLAAPLLREKGIVEYVEAIGPMGVQSRRLAEERFDVRQINRRLMALLGVQG